MAKSCGKNYKNMEIVRYRCPDCQHSIRFDGKEEKTVCENCQATYYRYEFNDIQLFDFFHLTDEKKCSCNRDGFTECSIDLKKELINAKKNSHYSERLNPPVAKLLKKLKNRSLKILELGCAEGYYGHCFAKGNIVFGLDSCVKRLLSDRGKTLSGDYRVLTLANVLKIPFADKEFDVVIATELIEHILETKIFLKEINRVLKPGGELILSTPNVASFWTRMSLLFGSGKGFAPWRVLKGKSPYNPPSSIVYPYQTVHIRFFTFGSLREILEQSGFKVIHTAGADPVFCRIPLGDKVFRNFCKTIIMKSVRKN